MLEILLNKHFSLLQKLDRISYLHAQIPKSAERKETLLLYKIYFKFIPQIALFNWFLIFNIQVTTF